jgi:hypothetical protein
MSAAVRGRTRITERALQRVAAAVTADAFGSTGDRVQVELTDHDGGLDLAVTTAIRTVSLQRAIEEPRAVARAGGSILARTQAAEAVIRDRVGALTGRTVGRVAVRLSGVHLAQERRVR